MNTCTDKCPTCDSCSLVHDTKDYIYTYNDKHLVIPNVVGCFCLNCGEVVLDAAESKRVMLVMKEFIEENKCKCGSGLPTERQRRLTQYANESKNYLECCSVCIERDREFYRQMWNSCYESEDK